MKRFFNRIFNKAGAALVTVIMVMLVLMGVGTAFASITYTYVTQKRSEALSTGAEYEAKVVNEYFANSIIEGDEFDFGDAYGTSTIAAYLSDLRKEEEDKLTEAVDADQYFEKNPVRMTGFIDGNKNKKYTLTYGADQLSVKVRVDIKAGISTTTLSSNIKLLIDGVTNEGLKDNLENMFNNTPTYYVYEKKNLCTKNDCGFQIDYYRYNPGSDPLKGGTGVVPGHMHLNVKDERPEEAVGVAMAPADGITNVKNGKETNYPEQLIKEYSTYMNEGAYLALDYSGNTTIYKDFIINGPCVIYNGKRGSNNEAAEIAGNLYVNGDVTVVSSNIGKGIIANGNAVLIDSTTGWSDSGRKMNKINGSLYVGQSGIFYEKGNYMHSSQTKRMPHIIGSLFVRDYLCSRGASVGGDDVGDKKIIGKDVDIKREDVNGKPITDGKGDSNIVSDNGVYYLTLRGMWNIKGKLETDGVFWVERNSGDRSRNQIYVGGDVEMENSISVNRKIYAGVDGNSAGTAEFINTSLREGSESNEGATGRGGVSATGNIIIEGNAQKLSTNFLKSGGSIEIEGMSFEALGHTKASGTITMRNKANENVMAFYNIQATGGVHIENINLTMAGGRHTDLGGGAWQHNGITGGSVTILNSGSKGGFGRIIGTNYITLTDIRSIDNSSLYCNEIESNGNIIFTRADVAVTQDHASSTKVGGSGIKSTGGGIAFQDTIGRTIDGDVYAKDNITIRNCKTASGNDFLFKGSITAGGFIAVTDFISDNGRGLYFETNTKIKANSYVHLKNIKPLMRIGRVEAIGGTLNGTTFGVMVEDLASNGVVSWGSVKANKDIIINNCKNQSIGGESAEGNVTITNTYGGSGTWGAMVPFYAKGNITIDNTVGNYLYFSKIECLGNLTLNNAKLAGGEISGVGNSYSIVVGTRNDTDRCGNATINNSTIRGESISVEGSLNVDGSYIGSHSGTKRTLKVGSYVDANNVTDSVQSFMNTVVLKDFALSIRGDLQAINTFGGSNGNWEIGGNLEYRDSYAKDATISALAIDGALNDRANTRIKGFYVGGDFIYHNIGHNNKNADEEFSMYVGGDFTATSNRTDMVGDSAILAFPCVGMTVRGNAEISGYSIDKAQAGSDGSWGGNTRNWAIGGTLTLRNGMMWKKGSIFVYNREDKGDGLLYDNFSFRAEGNNFLNGHYILAMVYRGAIKAINGANIMGKSYVGNNTASQHWNNNGGSTCIGTKAGLDGATWYKTKFEVDYLIWRVDGAPGSGYGYGVDDKPYYNRDSNWKFTPAFGAESIKETSLVGASGGVEQIGGIDYNYSEKIVFEDGFNWNNVKETKDGYVPENSADDYVEGKENNKFVVRNYHYYQQQTHMSLTLQQTVPLAWRIPGESFAPGINTVYNPPKSREKARRVYVRTSILGTALYNWFTSADHYVFDRNCTLPSVLPNGNNWTLQSYLNANSDYAVTPPTGYTSVTFDTSKGDLHIKIPKNLTMNIKEGIHLDIIGTNRVFLYMQDGFKLTTPNSDVHASIGSTQNANGDSGIERHDKVLIYFIGVGDNIYLDFNEFFVKGYYYMPYSKNSTVKIYNGGNDKYSLFGAVVAQNIITDGSGTNITKPAIPPDLSGLDFLYLQGLPPGTSIDDGTFNGAKIGWVFEGFS